jgi:hypothetical protein
VTNLVTEVTKAVTQERKFDGGSKSGKLRSESRNLNRKKSGIGRKRAMRIGATSNVERRTPNIFLLRQGFGGGLLERAANDAGVAVREIGALHHQNESEALDWIDPRLRAPRSAMAEGAGGKHFGYAFVRGS